jgi:hypothetical protein
MGTVLILERGDGSAPPLRLIFGRGAAPTPRERRRRETRISQLAGRRRWRFQTSALSMARAGRLKPALGDDELPAAQAGPHGHGKRSRHVRGSIEADVVPSITVLDVRSPRAAAIAQHCADQGCQVTSHAVLGDHDQLPIAVTRTRRSGGTSHDRETAAAMPISNAEKPECAQRWNRRTALAWSPPAHQRTPAPTPASMRGVIENNARASIAGRRSSMVRSSSSPVVEKK